MKVYLQQEGDSIILSKDFDEMCTGIVLMIDTVQKASYVRCIYGVRFEPCSFSVMCEFINNSMLKLIIDRVSFYESEGE